MSFIHSSLICTFTNYVLSKPFTKLFPWADIHELLTPDLLHQVIKGTFKDHLVYWVEDYIRNVQHKGNPRLAKEVLADIDRQYVHYYFVVVIYYNSCQILSITCVPPFPGLRHFYEGRGFKQWTGNDSKGLMKVCQLESH